MQPLFEAISNSIHSTQERFLDKVTNKRRVIVTVITGRTRAPVKIVVEDNGAGLNDKNYDAFTTTDTDNKLAIGGKGVGRLLWLDCFEKIIVSSTYRNSDAIRRRRFQFVLSQDEQIQDYEESATEPAIQDTGFELIGWDTLLSDARDRNQAFFDRAGISGKSFFTDPPEASRPIPQGGDERPFGDEAVTLGSERLN